MKTLLILAVIGAGIMLCMLLRFMIKRLWLFLQLKKFAEKHNYDCIVPFLCILPLNSSSHIIQIKTGKNSYNIKPFGLLRKHCEIHFWSTEEYSTHWYFTRAEYLGSPGPIGLTNDHRRRSLSNTDWTTSPNAVPILLLTPSHAPVKLTKTDVNHLEELRAGDKIGDVIFADLDYLFRHIEKHQ